MTCTPRRRSVSRFSCTAGCSHISVCIAGASSTGARVASSVAVSRSDEIPAAYAPINRAVAGATRTRSACWPRRVCGIGIGAAEELGARGFRCERREGERGDEAGRGLGEHRRDVEAGVDEAAAHLDRLVRGDAAAHTRGRPARAATLGAARPRVLRRWSRCLRSHRPRPRARRELRRSARRGSCRRRSPRGRSRAACATPT